MQNTKKKRVSYLKKTQKEPPKCDPTHCTQCIFLSKLIADTSSKGKLYGKIKYANKKGKLQFTYYDDNISKMLGYSSQELIGKDPSVILHPADKKIMMNRAKDRIQGKEVENEYLARVKRKDGKYIIVRTVGATPNTTNGYPEAEFIVSTYCIPSKKKACKKSSTCKR